MVGNRGISVNSSSNGDGTAVAQTISPTQSTTEYIGPYALNSIVTGDARELAAGIPDESVDLIFTDPPYPRQYEQVYWDMGQYAPRVLKPGGSLITLCGHYQVPTVIKALETLDYRWIGWLRHTSMKSLFGRKIVCGGKPLLWFTKGKPIDFYGFWWDTIKPPAPEKDVHEWQQPAYWAIPSIEKLCPLGGVVLEPFAGGGTVPAVCKILGRSYIAFEIDPATAELARQRVANTQPPLPLVHAHQESWL